MKKTRFSVSSGGGANLSSLQAFRDCQKNKTCYNSDVLHQHYRKGYMKKQAFTLAEVLITLGIIGVVAAMTMPTLIANHRKQVYVSGLKKGMSTISNMFQKMIADEEASGLNSISLFSDGMCTPGFDFTPGEGCEDLYGNTSLFDKLIPKYIKVVKTCTGSECDIKYIDNHLNCDNSGKCSLYKFSYGDSISIPLYASGSGYKGYFSADGIIYYFAFAGFVGSNVSKSGAISVCMDVNGEKGPNARGRDLFCLAYCHKLNGKILPRPNYDVCNFSADEDDYKTYPLYYLMQNGYQMDY